MYAREVQASNLYFSINLTCLSILFKTLSSSLSCLAIQFPLLLLINIFKDFVSPIFFLFLNKNTLLSFTDFNISYVLSVEFAILVLNVACYEANALLPNGENAHITVRTPHWWKGAIDLISAEHPSVSVDLICSPSYDRMQAFPTFSDEQRQADGRFCISYWALYLFWDVLLFSTTRCSIFSRTSKCKTSSTPTTSANPRTTVRRARGWCRYAASTPSRNPNLTAKWLQ